MPLDLSPLPVVVIELARSRTHLAGHEFRTARGQIGVSSGEPALPQQVLQRQPEPDPPGTGHAGQPLPLVWMQREVLDQSVLTDRVRHDLARPTSPIEQRRTTGETDPPGKCRQYPEAALHTRFELNYPV